MKRSRWSTHRVAEALAALLVSACGSQSGTNTAGSGGVAGALGGAAAGGSVGAPAGGFSASPSSGFSGAGGAAVSASGASSGIGGTVAGSGGASSGAGGTVGSAGASPGPGGTASGAASGTSSAGGPAAGGAHPAADAGPPSSDAGAVGIQGPSTFHGVNWADARDNFVDGLLQLSGLDTSADTYSTVAAKSGQIVSQFRTKLEANTIRIPINEPTVSSAWWAAYKAVVDTATASGMKVMVAYWAHHNGKPDDEAAFKNMWQAVVSTYMSNNRVYFDIHNEPYGFGSSWNDEAARWLSYFPDVPRGRVVVAGTGYDDNVVPVGSDKRFDGCLLEYHIYGFQHTTWTTTKQWTDAVNGALGSFAGRTIVGEWGDTMNSGTNYDATTTDGDNALSYVATLSNIMRKNAMGNCYWPGLRNGDGYSMTRLSTAGTTITLTVVNASGLDRLHAAWGL
jgi:endoglucanase